MPYQFYYPNDRHARLSYTESAILMGSTVAQEFTIATAASALGAAFINYRGFAGFIPIAEYVKATLVGTAAVTTPAAMLFCNAVLLERGQTVDLISEDYLCPIRYPCISVGTVGTAGALGALILNNINPAIHACLPGLYGSCFLEAGFCVGLYTWRCCLHHVFCPSAPSGPVAILEAYRVARTALSAAQMKVQSLTHDLNKAEAKAVVAVARAQSAAEAVAVATTAKRSARFVAHLTVKAEAATQAAAKVQEHVAEITQALIHAQAEIDVATTAYAQAFIQAQPIFDQLSNGADIRAREADQEAMEVLGIHPGFPVEGLPSRFSANPEIERYIPPVPLMPSSMANQSPPSNATELLERLRNHPDFELIREQGIVRYIVNEGQGLSRAANQSTSGRGVQANVMTERGTEPSIELEPGIELNVMPQRGVQANVITDRG